MKLADYIVTHRQGLEKHIHMFFEQKKKSVPTGLQTLSDTLTQLHAIAPKGKLLRGVQVMLSHEMFDGKNEKGALDAATALEIIQAAILIQDDFMDNDYMRRGQRSVFAQYLDAGSANKNSNPLLFGQSMATCVGDIGFFLAFELLNKCPKNVSQRLIELFSQEWQLVGAGQMMDVDFSSRDYEPTEEEVITIYRYKTARYSFSLPMMMGAILAGADQLSINTLDKLGEKLGLIFQIKDDELGIFGDEKTLGKPIGSDIRENKKTLLRSLLYAVVSTEEKKSLNTIFGKKDIKEIDIIKVIDLLKKYEIQSIITTKIDSLSKDVLHDIERLDGNSHYKNLLREFVELNLHRKK